MRHPPCARDPLSHNDICQHSEALQDYTERGGPKLTSKELAQRFQGVQGLSPLARLHACGGFDLVRDTPIDVMHVLSGVVKLLLQLLKGKQSTHKAAAAPPAATAPADKKQAKHKAKQQDKRGKQEKRTAPPSKRRKGISSSSSSSSGMGRPSMRLRRSRSTASSLSLEDQAINDAYMAGNPDSSGVDSSEEEYCLQFESSESEQEEQEEQEEDEEERKETMDVGPIGEGAMLLLGGSPQQCKERWMQRMEA